jgi:hypothetical protein
MPSNFGRFFSAIKKAHAAFPALRAAVTGILPVAMPEFAGSGGNNFTSVDLWATPFRGLFGLTAEDVKRAVRFISPPLPDDLSALLVARMERQMNGYRLEDLAEETYFNPARVAYSLSHVQERWRAWQAKKATSVANLSDIWNFDSIPNPDTQTMPADHALKRILRSPHAAAVIKDLLETGPTGIRCGPIQPSAIWSMLTSKDGLISYLYFTGAITYAGASVDPKYNNAFERVRVCVPNEDARADYFVAASSLLAPDGSALREYHRVLSRLLEKDDMAPLGDFYASVDRGRDGRGVLSTEDGFHGELYTVLNLARLNMADRVLRDKPLEQAGLPKHTDIIYEVRCHSAGID